MGAALRTATESDCEKFPLRKRGSAEARGLPRANAVALRPSLLTKGELLHGFNATAGIGTPGWRQPTTGLVHVWVCYLLIVPFGQGEL